MRPVAPWTVVLIVGLATSAAGQMQRDAAREQRVVEQLSARAPASVAEFVRATADLDAGNCQVAVPLFRDVLRAAPAFTPAMRRLGFCLMKAGFTFEGLGLLEQAVNTERSAPNLVSLAEVLAFPGDGNRPSTAVLDRAMSLAKEAAGLDDAHGDPSYLHLVAQISLAQGRTDTFKSTVTTLRAAFPNALVTHYNAAILAALESRSDTAQAEIEAAERLGMPHQAAVAFLQHIGRNRTPWQRVTSAVITAFELWLAGLALVFLVGQALSKATLRSLDRADANSLASHSARRTRLLYRGLVQAAGIYYYVSLPFVAVLVLGLFAAVLYVFLRIGEVPIMFVFSLGVGAVLTVYRMVQSLFIRPEHVDPGRRLDPFEAPGLWTLAEEVAQAVGTRTIDEIRVTPTTEMAVYERGSAGERREDRAARVLILGVGLLNGFREPAFRAVLAHEYGHFSHRDTAGGDVALRVRRNMTTFAISIIQHGQARWWNVAFQFLRLYGRLYYRITSGATRLQEVMADRLAARIYGPGQFVEGLRHVVWREIEFKTTADVEVRRALLQHRAIANLYALDGHDDPDVKGRFSDALERQTTANDTHPAPADRFRLVQDVAWDPHPTGSGLVWDLFAHREALTAEMTAVLVRHVQVAPS